MKNLIITIAIICAAVIAAVAQPRAIGARAGYNFEVSYQHELANGMLEVDAGFSPFLFQKGVMYDIDGNPMEQTYYYGRAQITLVYDWLMNITPNLNWYIGPAVGVSWGYGEFFDIPHYDKNGNLTTYRRLGLPAGGQIGLEYNFDFPLNLSLDWRPMFNIFGLRQGDLVPNLLNIAAGIRYRF